MKQKDLYSSDKLHGSHGDAKSTTINSPASCSANCNDGLVIHQKVQFVDLITILHCYDVGSRLTAFKLIQILLVWQPERRQYLSKWQHYNQQFGELSYTRRITILSNIAI